MSPHIIMVAMIDLGMGIMAVTVGDIMEETLGADMVAEAMAVDMGGDRWV